MWYSQLQTYKKVTERNNGVTTRNQAGSSVSVLQVLAVSTHEMGTLQLPTDHNPYFLQWVTFVSQTVLSSVDFYIQDL